jgi:hypothetical protein
VAARSNFVRRTEFVEPCVQRVEHAHHGREGRMNVAGFDARKMRGSEAREARGRPLRLAALRTNRGQASADIKL